MQVVAHLFERSLALPIFLQKSTEEAKSEKKEDKSDEVKKPEAKKAKKLTKSTDLKIDPIQAGLTAEDITNLISIEQELQFHARVEKERADAKNSLEEYIYAMRDKLYGELEKYVEEGQRDEFSVQLEDGESWLYGDGEDLQKQAYIDKLEGFKVIHLTKFGFIIGLECLEYKSHFELLVDTNC